MWRPVNLCEKTKAVEMPLSALAFWAAIVLGAGALVSEDFKVQLLLGSVFIALGTAASMVILERVKGTAWKWARALFVGVILAFGSYIASDSFDRREQYFSDRDTLVSFNVERMLNQSSLEATSFAYQDYRTSGNLGFMFGYVPLSFSAAHLVVNNTAIVRRDPEFARVMNEYQWYGKLLASELLYLEKLSSGIEAKSKWTKEVIQEIFGESGVLNDFLKRHQAVEDLVVSRYEWSSKEVWNRLDQSFFDRMKAFYEVERRRQDAAMKKSRTEAEKRQSQP